MKEGRDCKVIKGTLIFLWIDRSHIELELINEYCEISFDQLGLFIFYMSFKVLILYNLKVYLKYIYKLYILF